MHVCKRPGAYALRRRKQGGCQEKMQDKSADNSKHDLVTHKVFTFLLACSTQDMPPAMDTQMLYQKCQVCCCTLHSLLVFRLFSFSFPVPLNTILRQSSTWRKVLCKCREVFWATSTRGNTSYSAGLQDE